MQRIFIALMFTALMSQLIAQPVWVNKVPSGYANDYFVGRGVSTYSNAEASSAALSDALTKIVKSGTIKISVDETVNTNTTETNDNGDWSLKQIDKIAREIKVKGKSSYVKGLKEVESYAKKSGGMYEYWVLVSVPKKYPLKLPSKFSAIWRSVMLPGWGQFYKDDTFKGFSFMVLTLGSVAGGFVLKELSTESTNNALSSRTQARRDFYNNQAKDFNTYSTISFISAIVLYAWNIVDATIVKQDNLYVKLESNGYKNQIIVSLNF